MRPDLQDPPERPLRRPSHANQDPKAASDRQGCRDHRDIPGLQVSKASAVPTDFQASRANQDNRVPRVRPGHRVHQEETSTLASCW